jgi:hypothetical protein
MFDATYVPVQTNCAPLSPIYKVPFDPGVRGVNETNMNFVDKKVKTQIVLKGCSVSMTQTVTNMAGQLELQISGPELSVDGKSKVSGLVDVTRYDANQQVMCAGKYDAKFTQLDPTHSTY